MASIALVLSIVVPTVGNWWYLLTLFSPAAWFYYFQKGERTEQVSSGLSCAAPPSAGRSWHLQARPGHVQQCGDVAGVADDAG